MDGIERLQEDNTRRGGQIENSMWNRQNMKALVDKDWVFF